MKGIYANLGSMKPMFMASAHVKLKTSNSKNFNSH